MSHRYYHADILGGQSVELHGDEAHHALRVMRVKQGDQVTLFDGLNNEAIARVESAQRRSVVCSIEHVAEVDREAQTTIILGVALPKGDRARSVIERAVELGAAGFVPLTCQRSVALPSDGLMRRLNRYVIDASKQCGRNRLMAVAAALPWSQFINATVSELFDASHIDTNEALGRFVAHPTCERPCPAQIASPAIFAIGPEGGFDDAELELAQAAAWEMISLGPRILRVETAVSMVLSRGL